MVHQQPAPLHVRGIRGLDGRKAEVGMIDYTHIPLHIRCTDRQKIDPTYPLDGRRFWRLSERVAAKEIGTRGTPYGGITPMIAAYASKLADDDMRISHIAGALRVDVLTLVNAIKAHRRGQAIGGSLLMHKYEEMTPSEIASDAYLQEAV